MDTHGGRDDAAGRDETDVIDVGPVGDGADGRTAEGFTDESGAWRWRLRDTRGRPVAESRWAYPKLSLLDQAVEFGAIEGRPSVVEVYHNEVGIWRWRLRHRDGTVIATSLRGDRDRNRIEAAIERFRAVAGEADVLSYDPAGFEVRRRRNDEGWTWVLRYEDGLYAARSGVTYASRDEAWAAIERVRTVAGAPENFDVFREDDHYEWRLTDAAGETLAHSTRLVFDRSHVEETVERISRLAPDAALLDFDPAAYDLYPEDSGNWCWRLRHRDGTVVAECGDGYSWKHEENRRPPDAGGIRRWDGYATRHDALTRLRRVQREAPDAEVVELES